jgi:hypothetical protein
MAAAPAITKHQLESNLIEKCWKDPKFRSEVLKNPKGMLEALLGKSLPPDFKVVIHEEDAKTLHLALPPAPANTAELSDEELEKVAGGTGLALPIGRNHDPSIY